MAKFELDLEPRELSVEVIYLMSQKSSQAEIFSITLSSPKIFKSHTHTHKVCEREEEVQIYRWQAKSIKICFITV